MVEAQLAHLKSLRVNVKDMVHVKVETKPVLEFNAAGGLTVGDWVEVTQSKRSSSVHRAFLKEHFKTLPGDIMEVYEKASRERLAYHGFIGEAIVDTLNDNNEQAYRQLDKV